MAGETTKTTLANWIPENWAAEVQLEFEARTVMGTICNDITAQYLNGDTMNFEIVKDFEDAANDITESSDDRTFEAVKTAQNQLTIDKFKDKGFKFSIPAELLSKYDIRAPYTRKLEYVLRKYFDEYLAELAVTSTGNSIVDLTSLSAKTDTEILQAFEDAMEYLYLNDVPAEECVFALHPTFHLRCRRIMQFSSMDYTDVQALRTGNLPTIHGVPVIMTRMLHTDTVSGASVVNNLLLYKDAIRYVIPRNIKLYVDPPCAKHPWTYVASELVFGAMSNPDNGTSNKGIVVIQHS